MSVTIPLRTDLPHYDLQAVLDGATYTLTLRWNVREAAWFLAVSSEDGQTNYMQGVRVVCNFPLGVSRQGRQPGGVLLAVDTTGSGVDPGWGELGERVQLLYFSRAELGL